MSNDLCSIAIIVQILTNGLLFSASVNVFNMTVGSIVETPFAFLGIESSSVFLL